MKLSQEYARDLSEKLGIPFPRLNYLVTPHFESRSAYFEVPKTGCTAVKFLLLLEKDSNNYDLEATQIHNETQKQLPRLRYQEPGIVDEILFGDFQRFAFVRDPKTRVLSAYLDKIMNNSWERNRLLPGLGLTNNKIISFAEFIDRIASLEDNKRDIHFASQSRLIGVPFIKFDYIGKFETFSEDFEYLKNNLLKAKTPINFSKKTKHHSTNVNARYSEFYTKELEHKVSVIYHEDFLNFGYKLV